MFISYNNLWKTLIDKDIKKGELCKKFGISCSSTLSKMSRNEPLSLFIILKIGETLDCAIEDVVSINKKCEVQNVEL
jgi:DNA-binding Xre family transcriptional regulator